MAESDDIFKGYNPSILNPIQRVVKVAKSVGNLFLIHQLSDRSDHFQHDSLASPIEPVTSMPGQEDGKTS